MPIYEFECAGCGHRFDHLQKLSDADPTICPTCAAPQLRRMVSAPSFRLAGSGWYETDFKKDSDKKRNLADGANAGASAGADSGSEAKPASADKAAATPAAAPAPAATPAPSGNSGGGD
jgi:putative FmdB family regulatory protein